MQWRDVSHNIVIANYGGSKEVDNDDGSLFWRVHDNFMTFGWGQVFFLFLGAPYLESV